MEGGVGSRQSRASSRYAPGPSPPAFNGPVRKWKKQWVTASVSNNSQTNRNNAAPPLLICRWTPLSPTASADQPPTRRFRYTPVVPIQKGKTNVNNEEARTSIRNQTNNDADITSDSDALLMGKPRTRDNPREEAEELSEEQADSNKSPSEKRRKVSPTGEAKMLV